MYNYWGDFQSMHACIIISLSFSLSLSLSLTHWVGLEASKKGIERIVKEVEETSFVTRVETFGFVVVEAASALTFSLFLSLVSIFVSLSFFVSL
jgi:hypothetical protein